MSHRPTPRFPARSMQAAAMIDGLEVVDEQVVVLASPDPSEPDERRRRARRSRRPRTGRSGERSEDALEAGHGLG